MSDYAHPQVLVSHGWMLAPATLLVAVILAYYALGEALKNGPNRLRGR